MLIADGAPLTRWALQQAFASEGFEICAVASSGDLLAQLLHRRDALIVSARRFGDDDVMPLLNTVARARPDLRVIVLGSADEGGTDAQTAPNLVIVEQPFAVADLLRIARNTAEAAPQRNPKCL